MVEVVKDVARAVEARLPCRATGFASVLAALSYVDLIDFRSYL